LYFITRSRYGEKEKSHEYYFPDFYSTLQPWFTGTVQMVKLEMDERACFDFLAQGHVKAVGSTHQRSEEKNTCFISCTAFLVAFYPSSDF
jgi:hypothetical protein